MTREQFAAYTARRASRRPFDQTAAHVDLCLWCGQVLDGHEPHERPDDLARRMAERWGWRSWRLALAVVQEREARVARFSPQPVVDLDLFGGAL